MLYFNHQIKGQRQESDPGLKKLIKEPLIWFGGLIVKTTNIEFTRNELCEVRSLITSEMLKASEILDEIGDSNDSLDRRLFSYWHDKYQVLKGFYN